MRVFLMGRNGAVLHLSSDVAKLGKSAESNRDDERCRVSFISEVTT